jgi:hypothetical protein
MTKKKMDIAQTAAGKYTAANKEAADRGELDASELNGVLSKDPDPPAGVKLEPVRDVAIAALTPHKANVLFAELPAKEREALKADIKERGVLVPVIATADGVILSGHRRVEICKELGKGFVPVCFVVGDLTSAQEREFLIKDNLLRRHLGTTEKKALIVELYGEEIDKDHRGGDRKSAAAKIKSENFTFDSESLPERIERDTGGAIKRDSAKRTIAEIRKERKGETPKPTPAADPLKAVRSHLEKIVKLLDGADRVTIDAAIVEIVETLDRFGIDGRYSELAKEIIQNVRG